MDCLVRGALVVGEYDTRVADVLVRGERIAALGGRLEVPSGCDVIEGEGKILVPGGVDAHTHFCLDVGFARASDDFYTGTAAAALGGTTTIIDHPGFGPAGCALDCQITKYHGLAEGRSVIDYGFHGVLQHVDAAVLRDMEALAGEGVTSFKLYLTYDYKLADGDVFRVLERARALGLLVAVHAENDGLIQVLRERFGAEGSLGPEFHARSRPAECEAEAVNRMILLAHAAGEAPLYLVHLSSSLSLDFVKAARVRGQRNVYAETCPQYLLLDDSRYGLPEREGLKYLMCPPLRTKADNEALWAALESDIDTVATDHCPFFFATQKMRGKEDFRLCPSGAPGVQERIPLLFSEGVGRRRVTLRRFVELCATNSAKLFGLYPQKGVIRVGSDADLVLIDPNTRKTLRQSGLRSNVDYCAYEGFELRGWPEVVLSRGEVIVRGGELLAKPGRGRYLRRGRPAAL